MPDSVDFNQAEITQVLRDGRVRRFLKVVEEHPLWNISQMVDETEAVAGTEALSNEEARIVLHRVGLSSQSARMSNFSRVQELLEQTQERMIVVEVAEPQTPGLSQLVERHTGAQKESKRVDAMPLIETAQSIISKTVVADLNSRARLNKVSVRRPKEEPRFSKALRSISHAKFLRVTFSSPYYIAGIFLVFCLIYWVFARGMYQSTSPFASAVSLPSTPKSVADLKGMSASQTATMFVK